MVVYVWKKCKNRIIGHYIQSILAKYGGVFKDRFPICWFPEIPHFSCFDSTIISNFRMLFAFMLAFMLPSHVLNRKNCCFLNLRLLIWGIRLLLSIFTFFMFWAANKRFLKCFLYCVQNFFPKKCQYAIFRTATSPGLPCSNPSNGGPGGSLCTHTRPT